jgi:hypothetical protein
MAGTFFISLGLATILGVKNYMFLSKMLLIFGGIIPIILAFILGSIGQNYIDKRTKYKANIKEYRQRKFFTQIINLIKTNELNKAINIYNDLITKDEYRNFLFPFIINEYLHSDNIEANGKGEEKLAHILSVYNPLDFKF